MAKKRKLRSSEPEAATVAEVAEQNEEEQQQQQQPEEEEQLQQITEETLMEEEIKEEEYEAGEEEEEEGDEEDQAVDASNDAAAAEPPAQANGDGEEVPEDEGLDDLEEEPVEKLLEPFVKDQLVVLLKEAVSMCPEFIENVRKLADSDPAHRKIFVHGLGWDTTAESLTKEFSKYGEIEDCKAVSDKVSGKSKGYAFILFKHRRGAQKALQQPQKKIGNRITSCQLASAGPVPAPPPMVPPVSEYTQRKIFVSNVSADVDPQKLLAFFQKFGEIEDGPLGLDKNTGKPKGFALFVYKSVDSAKKALEEPHKEYEGVTLHCQKAIDGPKQMKQFHHQPHHHQPKYPRKDNKYSGGGGQGQGHLMAPSGSGVTVGFNPGVGGQGLNPALGQALTALLATQGAGLGLPNLLGGLGAAGMGGAVNTTHGMQGGYGSQGGAGYGAQPGMQGGYQNPQMGQHGGGRGHQGGGYMGH